MSVAAKSKVEKKKLKGRTVAEEQVEAYTPEKGKVPEAATLNTAEAPTTDAPTKDQSPTGASTPATPAEPQPPTPPTTPDEVETPIMPEDNETLLTTADATPDRSEAPATAEAPPGGAPASPKVNIPAIEVPPKDAPPADYLTNTTPETSEVPLTEAPTTPEVNLAATYVPTKDEVPVATPTPATSAEVQLPAPPWLKDTPNTRKSRHQQTLQPSPAKVPASVPAASQPEVPVRTRHRSSRIPATLQLRSGQLSNSYTNQCHVFLVIHRISVTHVDATGSNYQCPTATARPITATACPPHPVQTPERWNVFRVLNYNRNSSHPPGPTSPGGQGPNTSSGQTFVSPRSTGPPSYRGTSHSGGHTITEGSAHQDPQTVTKLIVVRTDPSVITLTTLELPAVPDPVREPSPNPGQALHRPGDEPSLPPKPYPSMVTR